MSPHPIIAAAQELQPLIRKHVVAGEQRARLTPEVVQAAGEAGLFRLFAPQEVGGLEVPPPIGFVAAEIASAADAAVGWCMVNSTPACHIAGFLPEPARAKLFAEPNRIFGWSSAPMGRGMPTNDGYHVSGTWPVVTGCEDTKWCVLTGLVMEGDAPRQLNGTPDVRFFILPTAELRIAPTWQESAVMQGTGSNEVSAQDVFVPEVFAYSPAQPPIIDRPRFRYPMSLIILPLNVAVLTGVLRDALDTTIEAISAKVASISGQTLRDQQAVQELVAGCDSALRATRAGFLETVDAIWELASQGAEVPMKLRAQYYASLFHAVEVARDTVSRLYARGIRAAFMQHHPLERALRNLHALAFANDTIRSLQHSAGRVLLGGEPYDPIF